MKRSLWLLVLALLLATMLAACGGGNATQPQANEAATVVEDAAPVEAEPTVAEEPAAEVMEEPTAEAVEEPTEAGAEPTAVEPATEEPAAEEPAVEADAAGGLMMSGIDPDSGLEINPAQAVPGVDYILRGKLVSFNLTPQDKPEFLIESPDGVRYRIQPQPVPEIFLDDGSQLKPHEYKRGMWAQATARLEESVTATSVMLSDNLTLLADTP